LTDGNGQLLSEDDVICDLLTEYFGLGFTSEITIEELPEVKFVFKYLKVLIT